MIYTFLKKYLVVSKKSFTFAPTNQKKNLKKPVLLIIIVYDVKE